MQRVESTPQRSTLSALRFVGTIGVALLALALSASTALAANVTVAQGQVTDSSDDSPLQGVTVECHNANGTINGSTTTDASGDYTCQVDDSELSNGETMVVEVRNFDGYRRPSAQQFTWNGSAETLNFQMTPAPKEINVTVKNDAGEDVLADVAAIPVDVPPGDQATQVSESIDGSGTLEVTGGRWMVTVSPNLSETNADRYPWVARDAAQEVVFTEDDSSESDTIAFEVIASTYKVQVKMVDADANILTENSFNGDIYFDGFNSDYGALTASRKINPDTGVSEIYLLPGVWKVSAIHPQLEGQSFDPEDVKFVLPDAPGTTDWGTIQASENTGTISGTLTVSNADTIENIQMVATNLDSGQQTTGRTDKGGAWSFSGLGKGEYSVTVQDETYSPIATGSANITSTNSTVTGVSIEALSMESIIAGTIKDGEDNAVEGLQGSVVLTDGENEFSAPVQDDGSYSMRIFRDGLNEGALELNLVTLPDATVYQAESQAVSLANGTTTQVDVTTADDEATVSGTIKDFEGNGLDSELGDDAEIMALNVDTGSVEKVEVVDGAFSMEVGPGTWTLIPQVNDKDATALPSNAGGQTVEVKEGESKSVNPEVQVGEGTVSGTVNDASGDPVAEAPVLLTNLPALQEAAGAGDVEEEKIVSVVVNTDKDGGFTKGLPEGEFTVIYGSNPNQEGETEPVDETVTITEGQTSSTDADYREAGSTVSGDIGNNFDTGAVTAYSEDGGTETVEVEKDGSYEMNLAPGAWEVVATGVKEDELYYQKQSVTVVEGKDKTVSSSMENTGVEFPAAVTVTADVDEAIALTNADGASVKIPAYATGVTGSATVTLQPVPEFNNSGDISQVGLAYEINVVDEDGAPVKALNRDATISLPIDKELAGGIDAKEMAAGYHNEDLESFLYDGVVAETDGSKAVIQTSHFSKFALTTTGDVSVSSSPVVRPKKLKYSTLRVKKLKKRVRQVRWNRRANAEYYVLRLDKRKRNYKKFKKKSKRWKKTKVFKNVTGSKKIVKKKIKKKFLKVGKTYRVRAKACNSGGCSKLSKPRKFTIK